MVSIRIRRRELFDRAWSRPMTTNAAELGTTATALGKLARGLGLPLPSSGYRMKKEAGKEPPVPDYPADLARTGRGTLFDPRFFAAEPLSRHREDRHRRCKNARPNDNVKASSRWA